MSSNIVVRDGGFARILLRKDADLSPDWHPRGRSYGFTALVRRLWRYQRRRSGTSTEAPPPASAEHSDEPNPRNEQRFISYIFLRNPLIEPFKIQGLLDQATLCDEARSEQLLALGGVQAATHNSRVDRQEILELSTK